VHLTAHDRAVHNELVGEGGRAVSVLDVLGGNGVRGATVEGLDFAGLDGADTRVDRHGWTVGLDATGQAGDGVKVDGGLSALLICEDVSHGSLSFQVCDPYEALAGAIRWGLLAICRSAGLYADLQGFDCKRRQGNTSTGLYADLPKVSYGDRHERANRRTTTTGARR
jgi:hypothetical protein